ncbi:MAG: cytochrome b [Lautropia sp.]|nr:cytochrome b [Lautropia sp.]
MGLHSHQSHPPDTTDHPLITDTPKYYGVITRFLHWSMAAGFAFLLFTALAWTFAEDQPWTKGLMYYHKSVGFILMVLIVLRVIWAVINHARRPPSDSLAAKVGHLALYALMFVVPLVAMIRQYGGARGPLEVFGVQIMQGSPTPIKWMIDVGSNFHSNLAWILFALAIGHILMVPIHRMRGNDVLPRMLGR